MQDGFHRVLTTGFFKRGQLRNDVSTSFRTVLMRALLRIWKNLEKDFWNLEKPGSGGQLTCGHPDIKCCQIWYLISMGLLGQQPILGSSWVNVRKCIQFISAVRVSRLSFRQAPRPTRLVQMDKGRKTLTTTILLISKGTLWCSTLFDLKRVIFLG